MQRLNDLCLLLSTDMDLPDGQNPVLDSGGSQQKDAGCVFQGGGSQITGGGSESWGGELRFGGIPQFNPWCKCMQNVILRSINRCYVTRYFIISRCIFAKYRFISVQFDMMTRLLHALAKLNIKSATLRINFDRGSFVSLVSWSAGTMRSSIMRWCQLSNCLPLIS